MERFGRERFYNSKGRVRKCKMDGNRAMYQYGKKSDYENLHCTGGNTDGEKPVKQRGGIIACQIVRVMLH